MLKYINPGDEGGFGLSEVKRNNFIAKRLMIRLITLNNTEEMNNGFNNP